MAADTVYEGSITMTRKGIGFFSISEDKEDLLIPAEWTNHALSGDIVKVAPAGLYRDPAGRMPPRESGKVLEIVSRARETFVGTLAKSEEPGANLGKLFIMPDYKKMHVAVEVRGNGGA